MFSVAGFRHLVQVWSVAAIAAAILSGPSLARAADKSQEDPNNPSYQPTPGWLQKLSKPTDVPNSTAATEAEMKAYTEVVPNTVGPQNKPINFNLVPIKGGKYLRGASKAEFDKFNKEDKDAKYDEGPQSEIEIEPFWMGTHEVTWEEYEQWGLRIDRQRREVAKVQGGKNDDAADAILWPTKPYTDMTFGMGKDGFPAICMTQLAAEMYCKWLSAKTGRYYRLPTEAEWEYACRAGTKTAYWWGDDPEKAGEYAWFTGNSDDKYHKIGQKKPNPWGLFDMNGNVAEWVADQYQPDFYKQFAGKTVKNPLNPVKKEFPSVVRGGSWDDDVAKLRSAARTASTKDWKMQDPQIPQSIWYLTDASFVGFRVVRPLRQPTPEEAKQFEPDPEILKEFLKAEAGKQ